ncbi:MAG: hypothetical protein AB7I18_04925 [Candidatus Berkiella sp.]
MNAISLLYQTLYVLGELCFFRAKPTTLPYSWVVLGCFAMLDCALNVYRLLALKTPLQVDIPLSECYIAAILSVLASITISYILLAQRKLLVRLNKFLIAIFGTEILITGFSQLISTIVGKGALPMLNVGLTAWCFAIQVQIIRQTFETKIAQSILLLFLIIFAASFPLWSVVGMNAQPQP